MVRFLNRQFVFQDENVSVWHSEQLKNRREDTMNGINFVRILQKWMTLAWRYLHWLEIIPIHAEDCKVSAKSFAMLVHASCEVE